MSLIEELRIEARNLRDERLPLRAAKCEAIAAQLQAYEAEIGRLREALTEIATVTAANEYTHKLREIARASLTPIGDTEEQEG